ncbi:MAG: PqiC family protein [Candidatus Thiodiazotropha sp.]
MKVSIQHRGLSMVLLVILLAGCASPSQPTRFYRLDGGAPNIRAQDLMPALNRSMLGVEEVSVAAYLDRPQIVERVAEHRLKLHEFDQWAGSFQENLKIVLGEELQRLMPERPVVTSPWPGSRQPDYRLELMVRQFDWVGDRIIVRGNWSLIREKPRELVALQRVGLEEPILGSGIDAVVAASHRSMGRWAQIIADWFRDAAGRPGDSP